MKKVKIFSMKSPYREPFHIYGYIFGEGEKTAAIVGAMRGDEIQQQFVSSQIVRILTDLEKAGKITEGKQILVIPSVNNFSMNIGKRFWPMDNTDINRMFPGYGSGETTQRIASALFEEIKDYKFGIQLASYHFPGDFIPHVRIIRTAVDIASEAQKFALPYVYIKNPEPFDTVMLNYNWQIWGAKAFSIYAGTTDTVDKHSAKLTWQAIMRFLQSSGTVESISHPGYMSQTLEDKDFITLTANSAGFFYCLKPSGSDVRKGETLAKILNPYDGSTEEEIISPGYFRVFFVHNKAMIMQHTAAFQLIRG